MTSVIKIEHLCKDFVLDHNYSIKDAFVNIFRKQKQYSQKFRALDDVNLTIEKGEAVGLVGLNGSGKSTLLKQISGVQKPDEGSVKVKGSIAGLIEVGAGFHPDLTGVENVFLNGAILGMSKKQIEDSFDDIVNFAEVHKFMNTNVRFYSSGMFLRLAFSVAVFSDPDIFLIDEILSVGDAPFRKKCMARIQELKEAGKTLVIVSHSQEQIKEVANRAIWLNKGKVLKSGDPKSVLDAMNEKSGIGKK